jgi:hypothetical protein
MQQCTVEIDADKHCDQAILLIHYEPMGRLNRDGQRVSDQKIKIWRGDSWEKYGQLGYMLKEQEKKGNQQLKGE